MIKTLFRNGFLALLAATSIGVSAYDSTGFNQNSKIDVSNGIPCDYTGNAVTKPGANTDGSVVDGVSNQNARLANDADHYTGFDPSKTVTAVSQTCNTAGEVSDPVVAVSPYPTQTPAAGNGNVCIANPNPRPQFCGTKTWTVPAGVTSFSALAIGGGGAGSVGDGYSPSGSQTTGSGSGGALSFTNNIPVNPGDVVTIQVGCGGNSVITPWRGATLGRDYFGVDGGTGQDSYVRVNGVTVLIAQGGRGGLCVGAAGGCITEATTRARGAVAAGQASNGMGLVRNSGGVGPDGFMSSGSQGNPAGGGAAGYAGSGGRGSTKDSNQVNGGTPAYSQWGQPGAGGGGAGGLAANGGGGTGIYGQGANGQPHWAFSPISHEYTGGSLGDLGGIKNSPTCHAGNGGYPGGGGGGTRGGSTARHPGYGAHGAVRIVWPGNTRQFPSTNVGP